MKSIRKYFFVMVAFAAVFAFVSCKDKEDDEPSIVAEYVYSTMTATFLDDGTWSVYDSYYGIVVMEGTYTGDPSGDNEVSVKTTKAVDSNAGPELVEVNPPVEQSLTIKDGKVSFGEMEFKRK